MWKPFIEWGAAIFGAALAGTKLAETSKTLYKAADEHGYFEGIKRIFKKF